MQRFGIFLPVCGGERTVARGETSVLPVHLNEWEIRRSRKRDATWRNVAARIVCRGASFEFNFLKGGYVPPGIFSNASVIPRNCWVNYILYSQKKLFPKAEQQYSTTIRSSRIYIIILLRYTLFFFVSFFFLYFLFNQISTFPRVVL